MQGNSILLISYWYPNKSNKNSGIFVKRHAGAIKKEDNVVILAVSILKGKALFKKTIEVQKDENDIETHHLYLESRFNKLLYVLLPLQYRILKPYVAKLSARYAFNIIHSNVIFPCGIMAYLLSKKQGMKHVITEHWTRVDKFFSKSLYAGIARKALDKAHAITCVSETLKTTVQKYTSNPRIAIVPNVIDSSQFFYDSSIAKNNEFTFIAVASWMPHKNPFYFLNALKTLYLEKKIPSFRMVIVGKGGQIEEMKKANYPFSIDYAGSLDADAVRIMLNKSHVFLHGSDYETFSVIIAEALLCGLPSVVSPYGIATEVIHAGNGFVTDNTPGDWEEKILRCYQTHYDNQKISEELKGKYDSGIIGKRFHEVYALPAPTGH